MQSTQSPHPTGNRFSDLVWRIFLNKMDASDGHFGLRGEASRVLENLPTRQNAAWLRLQK